MEVLKFERAIHKISNPSVLFLDESKVHLWVIHANKIPPHLGISKGTSFFSLKANGKDDGLPVEKILQVLERKKVSVVFYEVSLDIQLPSIQNVFDQYTRTIPSEITCLEPLKSIFNSANAKWLKELLQDLENMKGISKAFGWQLPVDFIKIPDYSPQDIHRRLKKLDDEI